MFIATHASGKHKQQMHYEVIVKTRKRCVKHNIKYIILLLTDQTHDNTILPTQLRVALYNLGTYTIPYRIVASQPEFGICSACVYCLAPVAADRGCRLDPGVCLA